ncbi:hypothetical protein ACFL02_03420 [Planctomycetota bacterium]
MAKQNNPQIGTRKDTITVIIDIYGNKIMEIGLHEYTVRHSDGSRTHRRISETIQTVDGTIWTPAMMAKIPVGVCEQCRESLFSRKNHGIVAMHNALLCADGGELCCPSHRRMGRDQKYRCLKHHRQYLLKNLARPIFFEREEDLL